jgi:KDO2-lipid IV(A) lauroyltransferase
MDSTNPDYKRLEPRKSRRLRPLRRWLQAAAARALLTLTAPLPVRAMQRLGRIAGRLGHAWERSERAVCEYQMRRVMPELSEAERARLTRRCFEHMGMTAFEALAMPRIRRDSARWLALEDAIALRAAHALGRGVVLVTAHCGNWEFLPVAAGQLRIPMTAVVKPLTNPRLNELMRRQRRAEFLTLAERGGRNTAKVLLQALRQGRVLVVAIDQDIDAQSVYADFFGLPARTPRVAASLALKLGVPIVAAFDRRREDGTHAIRFQAVPVSDAVRASADPEQALTQTLNNVIEAHIRAWPEQWAWNHRRWLHEPSRGSD